MANNFDIIIIGGGATGLGTAVEAASRGYKTLLLEAFDYGKGTSSKSTKLVHGGIRYLANLDFALVQEGLEERFYFLKNAPHLAKKQTYLIPFQNWFEKIKYWLGIRVYDYLAGKKKVGKSRFLSKNETLQEAPDLNADKILGGAIYNDGQFDDCRMLIALLRTFESLGGISYNYHEVIDFITNSNRINGVVVKDKINNQTHEFYAKVVVNATGTFSDSLMNLAEKTDKYATVSAAQGTHLVFDREIFDSKHAILVPETSDGRVLFILPWNDKVVVGTTDVKVPSPSLEPIAQESEIDFILETLNAYANKPVTRNEIRSVFCGQRPLVTSANAKNTAKISRKHEIFQTSNGLVTMVGGKWTIYRRMGQDTIDYIEKAFNLPPSKSPTHDLKLFGYTTNPETYPLKVYGSDANKIRQIQQETGNFGLIHPNLPYLQAEVIYQVRHEQAKTVEDVLSRRTRALFLNSKAALEAAPLVASLIAQELNLTRDWQVDQLAKFTDTARIFGASIS